MGGIQRGSAGLRRRDLAAGLAVAGWAAPESLYIPRAHRVEDRKFLHDFMDEFAFVELVTSAPEIRITHVPAVLDRNAGRYGTLYGHIARQNPQSATLDGRQPAVIVFRGPHAYISPSWSVKTGGGGTWNFAVVHAIGRLRAVAEKKALRDLLTKLIRRFESEKYAYDFGLLPESSVDARMAGAIGFEMEVERLDGKFKLGQERNEADREILLRNLRSARPPRSMHDFTEAFFARPAK